MNEKLAASSHSGRCNSQRGSRGTAGSCIPQSIHNSDNSQYKSAVKVA